MVRTSTAWPQGVGPHGTAYGMSSTDVAIQRAVMGAIHVESAISRTTRLQPGLSCESDHTDNTMASTVARRIVITSGTAEAVGPSWVAVHALVIQEQPDTRHSMTNTVAQISRENVPGILWSLACVVGQLGGLTVTNDVRAVAALRSRLPVPAGLGPPA